MTKQKLLVSTLPLFCYLIIKVVHGWEHISDYSLWFGVIIAMLAHARKNKITIVILFSHMAIEWFEWGSAKILFLAFLCNIFHAGMDFTFLHHEIKVHLKKNPTLILSGALLILLFIFLTSSQVEVSEEVLRSIHPFVLGGVIGCIASHIYFHIKKE